MGEGTYVCGCVSWDFGGREAAPRRVGVRVCVCVCGGGRREPARVALGGAGSRPRACGEGAGGRRGGDP